jgi:hypothetical protein
MDISKEYVLMCSKTTEIQSLPVFKDLHIGQSLNAGDFYYDKSLNNIEVISFGEITHENIVWLPSQSQLQSLLNRSI